MSGSPHPRKTPWAKRLLLWRAVYRRILSPRRSHSPSSGHDRLRRLLIDLLQERVSGLLAASGLLVGASLLSLPLPLLMGFLCDRILVPRDGSLLLPFFLVAGALVIGRHLASIIGEASFFRLHQEIQLEIQEGLIERVLRLPTAFFDAHTGGYLQSRIDDDMRGMGFLFSPALVQLAGQALQLLAGMGILLHLSPRLGGIVLLTLIPLALIAMGAGHLIRRLVGRARESRAQAHGVLQETLSNRLLVKSEAAERERSAVWAGRSRWAFDAVWEQMLALSFGQLLTGLLPGFVLAVTVLAGSHAVIDGTWTIGTFLAFLGTLRFVLGPAESLAFAHLHLQDALSSWNRLAHLASLAVEESSPDALPVGRLTGNIEFISVSFSYQRRSPVLREASFRLEPGSTVAIIGPSGAGKSTLVHLLMRLYEPTAGLIRFDGRPARSLQLADLRRRIGFLPQSPQFFCGSILDNLRRPSPQAIAASGVTSASSLTSGPDCAPTPPGTPMPDLDRIRHLARTLRIDETIMALPKGYDTELGEDGAGLSRGQLQRLALLRVLAADPDILILDEPTSALDPETAAVISQAIRTWSRNRTILTIAHDRRVLETADLILFIAADGTLRSGTPSVLAADPVFQAHLGAV